MIISASYKTDIPTFFGEWFLNRLREGFCATINPRNRVISRIPLTRPYVDGFVFWTKNILPFLPALLQVRAMRFPFVIQHTVNGYPRALEHSVLDWEKACSAIHHVASAFGGRVCVWRYDTILLSSITDHAFHLRNFATIANRLAGATDEVVISFAQIYKKTRINTNAAANEHGFEWWDPPIAEKRQMIVQLADIARQCGMKLTVCSQPELIAGGASEARCVDAVRLSSIAEQHFKAMLKGNRSGCGCFESCDIGEYDTCPHGCVYCYAVSNHRIASTRFKHHDPLSPFLFAPQDASTLKGATDISLPLFGS